MKKAVSTGVTLGDYLTCGPFALKISRGAECGDERPPRNRGVSARSKTALACSSP
jgi:hypothetical protein